MRTFLLVLLVGSVAQASEARQICLQMAASIQRTTTDPSFQAISSLILLKGKIPVPERNSQLAAYYSAAAPCKVAQENQCEKMNETHTRAWTQWCGSKYYMGLAFLMRHLIGLPLEVKTANGVAGSTLNMIRPTVGAGVPAPSETKVGRPHTGNVFTEPAPGFAGGRD